MTPLITTRDLYEAAANRTPILVYFDDAVYGPAPNRASLSNVIEPC